MKCVKLIQSSDGTYKLIDDQQSDINLCEYVLQSGSEVGNSPFNLTLDQGLAIGMSCGVVLAIAWGFKKVASVLDLESPHDSQH